MTTPGRAGYRSVFYDSYVTGHRVAQTATSGSQAHLDHDILPHIPRDTSLAILDVGCGNGQLIRTLRTHGYRNVAGIDISPQQVELAEALETENVLEADLFEHASDHRHEYDCVIAIDLAEHFDRSDVLRLFRTLRSLLAPGGRLILRSPNATSPFHGRYLYGDLTHGVAYTPRSLQQIAAAADFSAVSVYPCRPAGIGVKRFLRRRLWRLFESLFQLILAAETGVANGHIVTQNLIAVLDV